jgi:hypothetical protein
MIAQVRLKDSQRGMNGQFVGVVGIDRRETSHICDRRSITQPRPAIFILLCGQAGKMPKFSIYYCPLFSEDYRILGVYRTVSAEQSFFSLLCPCGGN